MPSVQKTHALVRLETFSDAVIAVAMTLLVLDVRAPRFSEALRADRFDYGALRDVAPRLLAFFLSFLLVALGWTTLVAGFRRATRATSGLIWLTLLYLFCVCLLPWGTATWSENPSLPQAVTIYGALWTLVLATGALVQRQLAILCSPEDPLGRLVFRINGVVVTALATATVLSAVWSVYVSFVVFPLLLFAHIIPRGLLTRIVDEVRRRAA